ncbi:hypothetical protein Tco_0473860, partial [Tanacetum coccineum]
MYITNWLLKTPRLTLDAMDEFAKAYVFTFYPQYHPATKIRVSVTNLLVDDIRIIRDDYVGNFSAIVEVVTRLSDVFQH